MADAEEKRLALVREQAVRPTPYTLHPTPYTLHPAPYTLHPEPYTLCTLHPTPLTLLPTPYTLHSVRHQAVRCSLLFFFITFEPRVE